jgi:hypothetical protein
MLDDKLDIIRLAEYNVANKLHEFNDLLTTINNVDEKKRRLWKEIYENAIIDRQNSYVIFTRLSDICQHKSTEHAVHGRTITACIERMSRANEQLIKLAELIAKSVETSEAIDVGNLYAKIESPH